MTDKPQAYREGKRRLKESLGRAKAEARQGDKNLQSNETSMLGQSILETIDERNLDSLMVYKEGSGRWYADLVLKNLPVGTPEAMGTPVDMPKSSKKEALKDAWSILVAILAAIDERKNTYRDTKIPDARVFELYGYSFSISAEYLDLGQRARKSLNLEDYTEEAAKKILEKAIEEICENREFSDEIFQSATREAQNRLLTGMTLMLLHGYFRYPERVWNPEH